MHLSPLSPRDCILIRDLLERGSRLLGLRMCFHDLQLQAGLPKSWRQHENPACMAVKTHHQDQCAAFCGQRIERDITGLPDGSIHTCPFGHTDIAAPVVQDGMLVGVLYAGVAWTGDGPPPRKGLVIPPNRQWLEDRRLGVCALARQLERLLQGDTTSDPTSRRDIILTYLGNHLGTPLRIRDLAKQLNLSSSRTGHLINDIFQETFPQLLTRLRLIRAAHLLSVTDQPIGEVALDTGFADQSHFTRAFRKRFHLTPREYRRTYRAEV